MEPPAEFRPAMPPPPGKETNLVDPEYSGTKLLATTCALLPIAMITLAIRIWTRLFIARSFRLDDYLMAIAAVLDIVMAVFMLDMLNWGLGKHMWDVPMSSFSPKFLKLNLVGTVFYCAGTGFNKASVLIFYNRIFPSPKLHIAVWILTFIAVGYSTASVFVNIFACDPIAMAWEPTINGTCIGRTIFYRAIAALGVFMDFATVSLPMPWLRRLQMPIRQKIAVGAILAMGGFWGVASIVRLVTLCIALTNKDLTWSTVEVLLWCMVELNMGIIGGCATAMRPFVRQYFPWLLGSLPTKYPDNYYPQSKSSRRLDLYPQGNRSDFVNGSHQSSAMSKAERGDDESEECIWAGPDKDGILRTVEFDTNDSSSSRL